MIGHSTTQKAVDAGRDNAAGNITNTNSNNQIFNVNLADEKSPIAAWMALLAEEISTNKHVSDFIDTLQMYHEKHSHDGIDGLYQPSEGLTHSVLKAGAGVIHF